MTSETDPEMDPKGQPSGVIDGAIAIAKGMGTVWKQTFRRDNTESYPAEIVPPPERSHIGRHQLNTHENGLEKCIGCELCAFACPADAIWVEGADNDPEDPTSPGERYAKDYQINYLRCIMCGLCVEACPTRALTLTSYYDLAFTIARRGDLDEGAAAPEAAGARHRPGRPGGPVVQADLILFWVFAPISVASAIAMLVMRNAVHSALFLIVNFFCLALFYLILGATFLFAVQIIVYAGAIMVLFLFVIMLLGVDGREDLRERRLIAQRPVAIALGVAFVLEVTFAIRASIGFSALAPAGFDKVNEGGNAQALAKVLFSKYFFPFEVTSILLIIAAIAAMILAQRKSHAVTQAEMEAHNAALEPVAPEPVA